MTVANPLYRHPEACHGPCYVLDPEADARGERVVIEVIPAKNTLIKKPVTPKETLVGSPETRRVVVWSKGRAFDWRLKNVPVRTTEPIWALRARELKRAGWSIRKIMTEIAVRSRRQLAEILDRYTV